MRTLALLFAFATVFTACKQDEELPLCDSARPIHEKLQGGWFLIEVFNPWTQESHQPGPNEQEHLLFGDSLTVTDFEYQSTTTAYNIDNGWLISGGPSGYVTIDSTDCNTLVIDNTPVDGPRKTYQRILED